MISANVSPGSSSASQCPPGNALPETFVARSFQTEINPHPRRRAEGAP